MENEKNNGPLSNLLVVDLTRVLGGPFCTQWLGDFGANVIKVEPPQGDETRKWGPPFDDNDTASYFIGVNRSKRGMSLDLSKAEGREILFRLLQEADVLVENFKIGTLEKWGIGYETVLREKFPRLVHCRISGFGDSGPFSGFPGYDAVAQSVAGWLSVNGAPETGPTRVGIPMVDIGTGMSSAFGIMVALHERQISGRGQSIDMTLYDTAISLLFPHAANWFLGGNKPVLTGNHHPNISPYDTFATRTCDIFIGVGNDGQFKRLCEVLEYPDLASDERFLRNSDRSSNKGTLREELEKLLANFDGEQIAVTLMQSGVPAGPVLDVPGALNHAQTRDRDMIAEVDDYKGLANPIKLSRTPAEVKSAPPQFGEHTIAILSELGYSADEIESFIELNVAFTGGK